MAAGRPNIIVIMNDTLRTAYLGCYGNATIRTPNIDRLAAESVRFTRAYPESLPTIPVRRAVHTARRAYPFRDYEPVSWDVVYLPGWQPMDRTEDTIAENLARAGYHTGFATDTLPYFAPRFDFCRGFWQWEYIRGMQQDRWQSVHAAPEEKLVQFGLAGPGDRDTRYDYLHYHAANTRDRLREQDTSTARTLQWGMDFLEDNRNAEPLYLFLDSFAPHEPWEAPPMYYEMYADPGFDGPTCILVRYGPRDEQGLSDAALQDIIAHYSGLVSLVDTWVGMLLDKLARLDLLDNTAIFFTSDHGTNFADNPQSVVGKPAYSLWPGVMDLPMLVRLPEGAQGGKVVDDLIYNIDMAATVYGLAGIDEHQAIHGRSLMPLLTGDGKWERREYVTSRYGDAVCYIDDDHWIRADVHGSLGEAFEVRADPLCQHDIAESLDSAVLEMAWERILADAGGELPVYEDPRGTDAIGLRY
jgi:arylsulfatase A-like enzyme